MPRKPATSLSPTGWPTTFDLIFPPEYSHLAISGRAHMTFCADYVYNPTIAIVRGMQRRLRTLSPRVKINSISPSGDVSTDKFNSFSQRIKQEIPEIYTIEQLSNAVDKIKQTKLKIFYGADSDINRSGQTIHIISLLVNVSILDQSNSKIIATINITGRISLLNVNYIYYVFLLSKTLQLLNGDLGQFGNGGEFNTSLKLVSSLSGGTEINSLPRRCKKIPGKPVVPTQLESPQVVGGSAYINTTITSGSGTYSHTGRGSASSTATIVG